MADNTDPLTVTSKKNSLLYCQIQYKVNYLTVDFLDTKTNDCVVDRDVSTAYCGSSSGEQWCVFVVRSITKLR